VKIKYRPIVALSDDVVSVFSLILSNPYILSYKIIYEYGFFNCQRDY
jgi:hypothetical protein